MTKVYVPIECYEVYEITLTNGEDPQEKIKRGEYNSVIIRFGQRKDFANCRMIIERNITGNKANTMVPSLQ